MCARGGRSRACVRASQEDLDAASVVAEDLKTEAWEASQRARASAVARDEAAAKAAHLEGEVERLRGELRARAREVAGLRGELRAVQEQANVGRGCWPRTRVSVWT